VTTAAAVVSTKVLTLTEGVMKAMFITKVKVATAALLLAVVGLGAAVVMNQVMAAEPPVKENPPRPAIAPIPNEPAADDTAKTTIEKAIKAHGGAEALAKLKVRQEKTEITYSKTEIYTTDSLIQLPDREKSTVRGPSNYMVIHGINGDKIWNTFNGKPGEETAESLKLTKERLHANYVVTLAPLLKEKRFTLSPLTEIKVNDRPALGVKVTAKDHADVDLYFDKDTGLLVKSEATRPFDGKDIVMSTVYSEYKEAHGLKWPRKRVDYWDEKQTRETEITELKFLDKIDDSEFAKP
jgi:hypothetical protein